MNQNANKSVVATADNAAGSLRSGRLFPAVPHFKRLSSDSFWDGCQDGVRGS